MKMLFALFVLLCATSCRQQSKLVTESCVLIQHRNQFDLVIISSNKSLDTLRNIDKIAWSKQELLLHKKSSKKGWVYIFDAGDVMIKIYGPYSNKEWLLRSKELQVENKFEVIPVLNAWEILK